MTDVVSDVVVLFSVMALTLAGTLSQTALVRPAAGLPLLAAAVVLLWRRRAPLAVAWITVATALAFPLAELAVPGSVLKSSITVNAVPWWPPAAPFAAYAAMAWSTRHRISWIPVAAMFGAALLLTGLLPAESAEAAARGVESTPAEAFVFRSGVFILGAALLGMYASARRRLVSGLRERVERAEREQHLLAERARADERARLAAEMHDVVAHRVTLMVLQAGALRVRSADAQTRQAAEELRVTGAQALEELRDVIGLLRRSADDEPPHQPLPDLSALVAESASVGVAVRLEETGDPPLASPVVGRTAYRIVQEALTNVHRHAPGAQVRVYVRYAASGVRLSVRNTAPARASDAVLAGAGSGTGLLGLRQRVELIGGRMRAGPDRGGGFHVEVYLPASVPGAEPAA